MNNFFLAKFHDDKNNTPYIGAFLHGKNWILEDLGYSSGWRVTNDAGQYWEVKSLERAIEIVSKNELDAEQKIESEIAAHDEYLNERLHDNGEAKGVDE